MLPFLPIPMEVAQQAQVQARVEERFRTGSDVIAEETELQPQLRYDAIWKGGRDHVVVTYQPRLVYTHTFRRPNVDPRIINPATLNLTDPNDKPASILQSGAVGLEMVRPRHRLFLYQLGAYGSVTTTSLLVQAPWNGETLPADPNPIMPSTIAVRFTLLFLQTQVGVPIKLTRRIALTPAMTYNAFGGADSASRAVMPFTSGPGASVALEIAATREDRLTTMAGAGRMTTDFAGDRTGPIIYRSELTQTWRHYWSRHISSELMGGGTVGGDELNGFALYSLASAGLLYDSFPLVRVEPGAAPQGALPGHGNRLQLGIVAKATPWIDIFSGELEQRGVSTFAANYTIARTTLRGQLSVARVFSTPQSVATYTFMQAEGGLRFAITPTFAADGGLRYGAQEFSNAIRSNQLTQTSAFVGIAWAPLPARF